MHEGQISYVNVTAQESRKPLTFNISLSQAKKKSNFLLVPFAVWYIKR